MHDEMMRQTGSEMMHGMTQAAGAARQGSMGLGAGMAKGAMMAGATSLFRSPLVMFLLGAAAGVMVYKYRKEIAAYAIRAGEVGRDFALQQKETLDDLLEEAREEETGKGGAAGNHLGG